MHKYLLFALSGLMLSGCAAYTATSGQIVLKDDSQTASFRFSDSDRAMIGDYYAKSASHNKAPGSIKLVKGDVLAPEAKGAPLPRELEQKLSPLPASHLRLRIGQDTVLIDRKTRVIADILYGAVK